MQDKVDITADSSTGETQRLLIYDNALYIERGEYQHDETSNRLEFQENQSIVFSWYNDNLNIDGMILTPYMTKTLLEWISNKGH